VCGRGRRVVDTWTVHMSVQGVEVEEKRDVRRLVSSCENDSVVRDMEFPLPLSLPRKKTIHNLPKTSPIKTSPSPVPWPRIRFPGRTLFSKSSCHHVGTTTKRSPHQTQPDVCPSNGPGLPVHPSQSGGQPPHLPLLPHTGVKKPTRR
jgi:hypothetical protein